MAAKTRAVLLCLAALCLPAFANVPKSSLLNEEPRQGGVGFAQASHQRLVAANTLIAPGIAGCLCDFRGRSRRTSTERDLETGLDYFWARYFSGVAGRFTSADAPLIDQHTQDPQSWNLYAYGRNNSLKHVDPTGNIVETLWDVVNVGMDVYSLGSNLYHGNWGSAAVDAGGLVLDVAATIVPFVPGGAGAAIKAGRLAKGADAAVDGVKALNHAGDSVVAGRRSLELAEDTVGNLRKAGKPDAHHVIQDAAVRDLPGYSSTKAPGVQLPGPASTPGTPHNATRTVQQQRGGGTYAAERRIGYKSLRKAGATRDQARQQIKRADEYFESIGVGAETVTRIPKDRR